MLRIAKNRFFLGYYSSLVQKLARLLLEKYIPWYTRFSAPRRLFFHVTFIILVLYILAVECAVESFFFMYTVIYIRIFQKTLTYIWKYFFYTISSYLYNTTMHPKKCINFTIFIVIAIIGFVSFNLVEWHNNIHF